MLVMLQAVSRHCVRSFKGESFVRAAPLLPEAIPGNHKVFP